MRASGEVQEGSQKEIYGSTEWRKCEKVYQFVNGGSVGAFHDSMRKQGGQRPE
jgi:hypothetical protein